jgi:hypothetical protein
MRIISLILIFVFITSNSFTAERSELEIKNKVFLEDIEDFGKFEPINLHQMECLKINMMNLSRCINTLKKK